MSLSYSEWKDVAITTYDIVSKNYNKKVYETVAEDENHEMQLVQLTLRDVLNKCENTIFETQMQRAIMKCVYTGAHLDREVRKIMDLYYRKH